MKQYIPLILAVVVTNAISQLMLKQGMNKLPQVMVNVEVNNPRDVAESSGLAKAVEAREQTLAGRGRATRANCRPATTASGLACSAFPATGWCRRKHTKGYAAERWLQFAVPCRRTS